MSSHLSLAALDSKSMLNYLVLDSNIIEKDIYDYFDVQVFAPVYVGS